ncbi:hypothetical protein MLD38_028024 [Melastoma candidum]|uniref:Uncharacterized protein n=1 Tax=Melastoma candidum TaxID=119954 RepID=A0ACB9MZX3_9MYRT|nr:hypothetical protein MLD38_028024 [Melastoma candidum]
MQDIHSLSGGGNPAAARLFAAGDSHLRPLHQPHPNSQALKCPRCDSLDTKFCYYNNYNLSQPRHFCKSCRRYWTKGGVLRNVPVGGGCRKYRRSSSSGSSSSSSSSSSKHPAAKPKPHDDSATASSAAEITTDSTTVNNDSINLSSGDSSILAAAVTTAELPSSLFQGYGSSCLEKLSMYGGVDVSMEMGDFAGIMGSTGEMEMTTFGYAGVLTQHGDPQRQQGMGVVEEFGELDWPGGEEYDGGGLSEVTGAVVDRGYWSQQNQWTASEVDADQLHHHHQPQRQGRGGLFLP